MGRHKKKDKIKENIQVSSGSGNVSNAPLVGILGWNSPRFEESHRSFLNLLKEQISLNGCRPVFMGISGGTDCFSGTSSAGKSAKTVRNDSSICDLSLAPHYWIPSRDLIADQIEMITHEEGLDGIVMVPWSVTSLVGMMMATARCGIPVLFLPNYSAWPLLLKTDSDQSDKAEKKCLLAYRQFSMPILLEVMGLTKIGIFEHYAQKKKMQLSGVSSGEGEQENKELISWGGKRISEMVKQKISSRRFFSQNAFNNALCADAALGNSTEAVLHLGAIAYESGAPLSPAFYNEIEKKAFSAVPLDRSGDFLIEELERQGGINALLGVLHRVLQASPTVMGKNIIEIAKEYSAAKSFMKSNAMEKIGSRHHGMAVLFGNLAREGALFRAGIVKENWLAGSGPVKVFKSEKSCVEAILSKTIKKGDVLVIQYAGPRGSPGMPPLNQIKDALEKKGLEESVMILTDGRANLSGKTPAIVHVSPEAAAGSPFSILQDGDVVNWNFSEKSLMVRLTETEIKVRLSRWKEQSQEKKNSFLYRYSKYSSSSAYGAILF